MNNGVTLVRRMARAVSLRRNKKRKMVNNPTVSG